METFVDDLVIKARKPYTITKQRERWTEEEHNRFLEALKLHGRAWQRIEEHIGTKTAVQIRSHAQKFFSKLEKEALGKGVSLGHTLEIDIPPPRPKRKPSYPYPRKISAGVSSSSSVAIKDGNSFTKDSSHSHRKEIPDMKNDSFSETPAGTETCAREQETLDDENCSEVTMLFQEPSCVSVPSANKISIPTSAIPTNTCIFKEFVHLRKEKGDKTATDESYMTVEPEHNQKLGKTDANFMELDNGTRKATKLENSCHNSQGKVVPEDRKYKLNLTEKPGLLSTDEIQANESYPRHVPVHIVDGSSGACIQTDSPDICPSSIIYHVGGTHGNPNLFTNPAVSATTEHHSNHSRSSVHQSMPNSPPCTPALHNQDVCRSFLNVSHTFPSLLMSTLLQNPAAHMAAIFAASFWPYTNGETSVDSSAGPVGGFPLSHMSASQNLAGIAAATVAAATAWWEAHGLLPLCPPIHPGFTVALPPTTATPMDIGHVPVLNKDGEDRTPKYPPSEVKQLDPEFCEAAKPQHSTSKQPTLSSSDSTESEGARSNSTKLTSAGNEQKPELVIGPNDDATKMKVRKKVDRSSCGSNTTSSSEVETDALEKQEKDKEEPQEPDASQQAGDPNNRRGRSVTNLNESWKEVSQEGRLAFQALFSREVLPQSFSPPHDLKNNTGQPKTTNIEGNQNLDRKDGEDPLCLDLNHKSWGTYPCHPSMEKSMNQNEEKGLLSAELGHGKFKARRTGFKPYKRCSVEAKESRMTNEGEEKGPKRIRLEGLLQLEN